jgi:hypothetical protein
MAAAGEKPMAVDSREDQSLPVGVTGDSEGARLRPPGTAATDQRIDVLGRLPHGLTDSPTARPS